MIKKIEDITKGRAHYKPFDFPLFHEYWTKQQSMHWSPFEYNMEVDIKDYYNVLDQDERDIIETVLKFFTQVELEVSYGYISLISHFKVFEIQSMIASFLNMETIHAASYSHLISCLKLDESIYKEFLTVKEMRDKVDIYLGLNSDTPFNALKQIACISVFTEGFILYSSFYILISLSQLALLTDTAQIATFAMRDETLHNLGMTDLYLTYKQSLLEYNYITEKDVENLEDDMCKYCDIFLDLEIKFIKLVFQDNKRKLRNLQQDAVISFIYYLAKLRLSQIGIKVSKYDDKIHIDKFQSFLDLMKSREHTDFFNTKPTSYFKKYSGLTEDDDMF